MTDNAVISHALILDDAEIERLRVDHQTSIRRRSGTRLRMPVALFHRSAKTVVGTAQLREAFPDEEQGFNEWQFDEVAWLRSPLAVSTAMTGPIWIRLRQQAREELRALESDVERDANAAASFEPITLTDSEAAAADALEQPAEEPAEINSVIVTAPLLPETVSGEEAEVVGGAIEAQPEEPSDPVEAAKLRAAAFIPDRSIKPDEARTILIRLRDEEIKAAFPGVSPEFGILRRAMLQSFLEEGVASFGDYQKLVAADLRAATNKTHVAAYLDAIIAILDRVDDSDIQATSSAASTADYFRSEAGSAWTDAELEAAVASYAEMLTCELNGIPHNKAARIRQVREGPLRNRSAASVTMRWQNISHLLFEAGRPFIDGLKPASNVGEHVKRRLFPMLYRRDLL